MKTLGIGEYTQRGLRAILHPKHVWHWIFIVAASISLLVTVLQIAFPRVLVVPFARLDNERVGSKNDTKLAQSIIDRYEHARLELKTAGPVKQQSSTVLATEAGLQPDIARALDGVKSYPLWQRLIPFSGVYFALTKNQSIEATIDMQRFADYTKQRLVECKVEPKNASVMIKDTNVAIDSAKDGQVCSDKDIAKAAQAITLQPTVAKMQIEAKTVEPERKDKDVQGLLDEAQKLANRRLKLKLLDTEYPVTKAQIVAWMTFSEDPNNKKEMHVAIDTAKVRDYVATMQTKIYIAPTVTTIRTVDGVEHDRTNGAPGRGLNHSTTAEALKNQLLKGDGVAVGEILAIPSKVVYERSYSATRAGLQAMLNDLVSEKGDFAIAVRMSDGTVVSANGTKRYHPASTYKMYVAYALLKRVEQGSINWSDSATAGKNIEQCMDVMIVNSDNTCAEWLGDKIGWAAIQNEVRALGLANTSTIRGAMYSTAEDEALFLAKLQFGSILQDTSRDRLLGLMKRQVYRQGVPAGTGVTVADKVGFLDGKLHDAAIVYGQKTYVLTILSQGSSWANIADAARKINSQMNRL
jgi:beta-lactamase class A